MIICACVYIYMCNINLHRPKAQNLSISTQFCSEHLHQATSGCQQHRCEASSPKPQMMKFDETTEIAYYFHLCSAIQFCSRQLASHSTMQFYGIEMIEWSWATDPVASCREIRVMLQFNFASNMWQPQLRFVATETPITIWSTFT